MNDTTLLFIVFVLGTFTLVYLAMHRKAERDHRRQEPVTITFGPTATGDSPPSWTSGPFTVAAVAMQHNAATAMAVAEGVASPPLKGGGGAMQRSPSDSLDPEQGNEEKNGETEGIDR